MTPVNGGRFNWKHQKVLPRIRLTLWSWELPFHGLGCRFVGSNSRNVIIGIAVPVLCALGAKYKPIKTIGFTTQYRDKDKSLMHGFRLWELINASVKCLYVKTSDSDVSATIEWKMEFKREPIEFCGRKRG
jgi:hypothetical protein